MRKLRTFYELWRECGRVNAILDSSTEPQAFTEAAAWSLFNAGFISEYDLRLCRLLHDSVYADDGVCDEGLLLFCAMMAASLNRGNVFLPCDAGSLAAECAETILLARSLIRQDGGIAAETIGLDCLESDCRQRIMDFTTSFDKGIFNQIIGTNDKPIVAQEGNWYFQKYFHARTMLRSLLYKRLMQDGEPVVNDQKLAQACTTVLKESNLDHFQKIAVCLACLNTTTVITGGPGTGKTTVVAQALRTLVHAEQQLVPQDDIIICAPTGRASARLQESIVKEASASKDDALRTLKGRTVHDVLGFDPRSGRFMRGPESPLDCRVVVVDESSMLDIAVFRDLLAALRSETKLILLGDRNQLPSIEAGAVLGDITEPFIFPQKSGADGQSTIPTLSRQMQARISALLGEAVDTDLICQDTAKNMMTDRIVILTESHRSQQDIRRMAHCVNVQALAGTNASGGFRFLATSELFGNHENRVWNGTSLARVSGVLRAGQATIARAQADWIEVHFGAAYVRAVTGAVESLINQFPNSTRAIGETQLKSAASSAETHEKIRHLFSFLNASVQLCVVRKGDSGSESANQRSEAIIRPMLDPSASGKFFNGCVALVAKTVKRLGLYNGDRGIVLRILGALYFVIERPDCHEFFPLEDIGAIEPSFAMTVHKSQGGEFDDVLLIIPPDANHPLLTKEILYTALTRAKNCAVVCGSAEACDAAIARKAVRRTGIFER